MREKNSDRKAGSINRRDFLRVGGLVGTASVLAACGAKPTDAPQVPLMPSWPGTDSEASTQSPKPTGETAMRIAHITDMHIQPSGPGVQGLTRALRDLQTRSPSVDFVLNTGDCVMDSLEADKDGAQAQWDAFTRTVEAECQLPVFHAIGNHDVWGWGLAPDAQQRWHGDPLFGKGLALQRLGIPGRYYSFDRAGWRFIVLDSTHEPDIAPGIPYTGKLDEEQFSWLAQQLEATPASTPVCVASHIPVLAACEFLDGDNETSGNWIVPGAWVHIDARRLWKLFWQHPNVKLCVSGHTHQVEDLRYHGVKYVTDGAISANWWNGSYFDFPPGYVVLTLYTDGSSDSEFVAY